MLIATYSSSLKKLRRQMNNNIELTPMAANTIAKLSS